MIGELLKYLVVPFLIGFCKVTSSYTFAKSKMVGFPAVSLKGYNQIPQTISVGKLPKNHAKHLIPTAKMPNIFIASIANYDTVKTRLGRNSINCAKTYLLLFIVDYFPLITISNQHVAKKLVKYRLPTISKNNIIF